MLLSLIIFNKIAKNGDGGAIFCPLFCPFQGEIQTYIFPFETQKNSRD